MNQSSRTTMELLKNHKERKQLEDKWKSPEDGKVHCVNCGSTEDIKWHHIVPLKYGGEDVESNIVPLCSLCHYCVHNMPTPEQRQQLAHKEHGTWGGRPRKPLLEGNEDIFWDYVDRKITRIEAAKRLGRSKDFFWDSPQWLEWCEKNHIERTSGKKFGKGPKGEPKHRKEG